MKKGLKKGVLNSDGGGGSVQSGLSSRETAAVTPESLGMANKGKNQTPAGPAKHKATGPFDFC